MQHSTQEQSRASSSLPYAVPTSTAHSLSPPADILQITDSANSASNASLTPNLNPAPPGTERLASATVSIDESASQNIAPLPGAVPKIQQPLSLSPFDQMRLEYHEDLDVAEGKADWVPPGQAGRWGSPSFVVDQSGKGLLGRPVRDYRYVNSQTADAPWPSANAGACLQRAQRGSIHSTLDAD